MRLILSTLLFLSFNSVLLKAEGLDCPKALQNSLNDSSLSQLSSSAIEKMASITETETTKYRVSENDRTEFYIKKRAGKPIRTKYSIVIDHGLLNSPSYTRWLAKLTHSLGFNVINARLPKHNHKKRRSLNDLEAEDMIEHTATMTKLAEELGEEVIYIGHSAGGLNALYSSLVSEKVKTIFVYAPALEVTTKTYWSSYLVGRTFLTNIPINYFNDDERYLSAAAGRATDQLGQHLQDMKGISDQYKDTDFGLLIERLSHLDRLFWIDTEGDQTIQDSINMAVANEVPGIDYTLVPANIGIPHVALASPAENMPNDEAKKTIDAFTQKLINYLKSL